MEDRRIEQINNYIAQYFFEIVHNTLIGQTPSNSPKPHEVYKNAVMVYIETIEKYYNKFIDQLKKIYKLYMERTQDIITLDILVESFVKHYSFDKVFVSLDGPDRVRVMRSVLINMLRSYLKFLCKSNEYAHYYTTITPELRQELIAKMLIKIRHHGVYVQFGVYRKDQETVPKYLFTKLRRQYDELVKLQ